MKEVNSRQIKSPHTGNSPRSIQPSKAEPPKKELSVSMKVILCISALALVFIAFAVVNASIGIKEIEIEGEVLCTEEEILSIAGIETGKGYFSYNSSKAEEKVKELLPCVDRIHISRSFFGKVKIDLEEEKGYWYVESYGEYFALSKGDIVFIERKRKAWEGNVLLHTVRHGETLYEISQAYGIRLRSLARLNRLSLEATITNGQTIKVR